jgi:drug/metabolite transporter (DMT)-like permease
MSDRLRSALIITLEVLVFLAFTALTVIGQRMLSWQGLGLECIGLAGVVGVIWFYNHTHK